MSRILYELRFPNGKRYIGVTNNLRRRWSEHLSDAKRGSPLAVHAAMRKHGHDRVAVRALVVGDHEYIRALEIKAIAAYGTATRHGGYNISPGGDLPSDETREKYRAATKRRWESAEYKQKMIALATGRQPSPEECARISKGLKGRTRSEQHKANISKALTGRKLSSEHVAAAVAGRWATQEQRDAHIALFKGRPARNGVAERNRASKGRKNTPQSIELMKASWTPERRARQAEIARQTCLKRRKKDDDNGKD